MALILGGIAILVIERMVKETPIVGVAEMPLKTAVGVGIAVPGDDPGRQPFRRNDHGRAVLGVERRTAAEFSFLPRNPDHGRRDDARACEASRHAMMAGASGVGFGAVAVGFIVSFIVAIVVVRAFVHYISRHGFAPFAWYRIVAGRRRSPG